jgi:hypothetical protein
MYEGAIPLPKASSGYKGISRIDHEGKHTHGWYVRVSFDRKMYAKFFSDASNGGREKCLKKAVRYRNQLEKELGKPRTDRIIVVSNKRNATGIIGVQRIPQNPTPDQALKSDSASYEVTWSPEPNVLRKASFLVSRFGEEGAFQRAVQLRLKMEKKMYGRVVQVAIPSLGEVLARLSDTDQKKKKKPKDLSK